MRPLLTALALVLSLSGLALPATAQQLTGSNYRSIREQVDLAPGDLEFQKIGWKSNVFDGLVEAQRADKPIFLWLYFGDPRGLC